MISARRLLLQCTNIQCLMEPIRSCIDYNMKRGRMPSQRSLLPNSSKSILSKFLFYLSLCIYVAICHIFVLLCLSLDIAYHAHYASHFGCLPLLCFIRFQYTGDEGYCLMSKALQEHFTDPEVVDLLSKASQNIARLTSLDSIEMLEQDTVM